MSQIRQLKHFFFFVFAYVAFWWRVLTQMYCLQHKLRLHKCLSVHPFCLFSVQFCHFLPGDNLFSGCGIAAGQICVYDSIVRSSTEHGGKELQTMNHKTWPSGRGRLWTISPPLSKKRLKYRHTKSDLVGPKGRLVHAERQMVFCQKTADKGNWALLVWNWK